MSTSDEGSEGDVRRVLWAARLYHPVLRQWMEWKAITEEGALRLKGEAGVQLRRVVTVNDVVKEDTRVQ